MDTRHDLPELLAPAGGWDAEGALRGVWGGVYPHAAPAAALQGGNWKVTKVQVKLPNSKTVVLSDQFVQKMWSPSPEIDPPTATEKDGITTITISTGDGGESTSSLLEITKELTVVELM